MVKVIAASLRKGNVVELDGKLYAVLKSENFHPGKGTPTTSVDMRRISDGVKVSERWRTTEMVEKASVDDRDYDFLYEDGEGYHFMQLGVFIERAEWAIRLLDVVGSDGDLPESGEARDTIEAVLEPYPIQQGYLRRTPRGRMATVATWRHFGLAAPSQNGAGANTDLWSQ